MVVCDTASGETRLYSTTFNLSSQLCESINVGLFEFCWLTVQG